MSRAFETISKKKNRNKEDSLSTCDQKFIVNCQEHNRSWKGSASVLASMRLLCGEKRDVTSMTVPKFLFKGSVLVHKSLRRVFISITVLTNSKKYLKVKNDYGCSQLGNFKTATVKYVRFSAGWYLSRMFSTCSSCAKDSLSRDLVEGQSGAQQETVETMLLQTYLVE